jgi:hypothetical protein
MDSMGWDGTRQESGLLEVVLGGAEHEGTIAARGTKECELALMCTYTHDTLKQCTFHSCSSSSSSSSLPRNKSKARSADEATLERVSLLPSTPLTLFFKAFKAFFQTLLKSK